jgi:hypothetical protein
MSIADEMLSTGEAARRLKVGPRAVTDVFYRGLANADACPIIGGRRFIPIAHLPALAISLRRAGYKAVDPTANPA